MGNFKNIVNQSVSGKISTEEAEKKIKKLMLSKKDGGGFPDLSGDGKTTMKDILIGRGVIKKKKGGTLKYRDGGQFRGCGAQVKGKKFKGIF